VIGSYSISETLVRDLIKNQKRDRFWRNLRFFIMLLIIGSVLYLGFRFVQGPAVSKEEEKKKDYVSLVRLDGYIFADADFSARNVLPILQDAFSDKDAKGVVLEINSGGGSPVQSTIIEEKILQLKAKYHKKVVVVGEDLLASGAYLVAMGADKVYVSPSSITGSIGVIMEGFGFPEAIKKIGVTRRVYTAGGNKDRLDPVLPESDADKEKIQVLLNETHQQFINIVQTSRGDRLKGDPKELFSGDFWTGETALKLGIVDGLGSLSDVLPKEFNVNYYVDYSEQPTLIEDIMKGMRTELD
jgi:protease-4